MPFTGYSSWISLFYVCQYSTAALLFRMKAGNSKSIWRHQNNKTEQTKLRAKQLERLNYRIIHTAEVQKQDIVTSVTSSLQCSHMADVTEMQCVISDSLWPYQILIKSLFSKTLRHHHLIMRYFYIARKCESRRINNPQSESLDKLKCFVSISSSLKLRQIIYSIWVSKHIGISYKLWSLILQYVFVFLNQWLWIEDQVAYIWCIDIISSSYFHPHQVSF